MPRKTKVTATPVEQQEEGLARAWNEEQPALTAKVSDQGDEAKTDAEQMTDFINEVKVSDEPPAPEPETAPEPTAKAKPRTIKEKQKTASFLLYTSYYILIYM